MNPQNNPQSSKNTHEPFHLIVIDNTGGRSKKVIDRNTCSCTEIATSPELSICSSSENMAVNRCICRDMKHKLIFMNLDRMLARLPDLEVDKLNHKFIGLTLEELEKYEGKDANKVEEPSKRPSLGNITPANEVVAKRLSKS